MPREAAQPSCSLVMGALAVTVQNAVRMSSAVPHSICMKPVRCCCSEWVASLDEAHFREVRLALHIRGFCTYSFCQPCISSFCINSHNEIPGTGYIEKKTGVFWLIFLEVQDQGAISGDDLLAGESQRGSETIVCMYVRMYLVLEIEPRDV